MTDQPAAGMTDVQIVGRALAYPFARPATSVAVVGERVLELVELDADALGSSRIRDETGDDGRLADACTDQGLPPEVLTESRTPVLAYGSNASPDGMRWKFPDDRESLTPLLRGTTRDLDVVYSAHITVYGSVAATLQRSPGTEVETFVALLTDAQLERVTTWEINARYQTLRGVELTLEGAVPPAEVGAYISVHGCLTAHGDELALADVPARGRRLIPLTQPEVLSYVRDQLAPGTSIADFILANVRDYDVARAHTAKLRAAARPFA